MTVRGTGSCSLFFHIYCLRILNTGMYNNIYPLGVHVHKRYVSVIYVVIIVYSVKQKKKKMVGTCNKIRKKIVENEFQSNTSTTCVLSVHQVQYTIQYAGRGLFDNNPSYRTRLKPANNKIKNIYIHLYRLNKCDYVPKRFPNCRSGSRAVIRKRIKGGSHDGLLKKRSCASTTFSNKMRAIQNNL